jgi:hypothetical protein
VVAARHRNALRWPRTHRTSGRGSLSNQGTISPNAWIMKASRCSTYRQSAVKGRCRSDNDAHKAARGEDTRRWQNRARPKAGGSSASGAHAQAYRIAVGAASGRGSKQVIPPALPVDLGRCHQVVYETKQVSVAHNKARSCERGRLLDSNEREGQNKASSRKARDCPQGGTHNRTHAPRKAGRGEEGQ